MPGFPFTSLQDPVCSCALSHPSPSLSLSPPPLSSHPLHCQASAVTITGFTDVDPNEQALKEAVAQQPVAVAIDASQSLQFYAGVSGCQ